MKLNFDRSSRRRLLGAFAFIGLVTAAACGGGSDVASGGDLCDGKDCGASCEKPSDCDAGLYCNDGKCSSSSGYECTAAKCGDACDASSDCGAGLYCNDGKCAAQCATSAHCASGQTCTADGRCIEGPDFGTGGNGNGGEGGGSSCIDIDVTFKPQTPTVVLLIDQSGSMGSDGLFDDAPEWDCPDTNDQGTHHDGNWRWNVARYVLMHPEEGVVKPLEDKVRFGMAHYTSENGSLNGGTCPMLDQTPIALNNHQAMLDNYHCSDMVEDTPTGEALEAVATELALYDEPGPKVIVLATDGEPDSCECPDYDDNDEGWLPDECKEPGKPNEVKEAVVAVAQAAHDNDDITIHVINVGDDDPDSNLSNHLEEVAMAGGGLSYLGASASGLKQAFQDIVNGSRNCIIDLDGSIAEGKETEGSIVLNGEKLELDDPNGWKMNSASQIELLGDACETIKTEDDPMLSIKFPCEGFIPDIIK